MKNYTHSFTLFLAYSLLFLACTQNEEEKKKETIREGKMRIAFDESLKNVIEEQITAYKIRYPKAEISTLVLPEQQAVNLMLQDSVDAVAITRELTANEQAYFTNRQKRYEPATMALDAVLVIGNISGDVRELSLDELKKLFEENSPTKLFFDNSNSSNLNFIKERLEIKEIKNQKVYGSKGTEDLLENIKKNKDAIGFLGYNWISEENETSRKIKSSIRIIPISSQKGQEAIEPNVSNLKSRKYPLERLIYLHTTDNRWGVPMGFIRFSCSQIGQLVVEKMGLIPYYIIPKQIVVEKKPLVPVNSKK
ncbi:MAG: PstS family phosphate ABC transporter substrate-binding protein [Spirosomataceae bacterium]